MKYVNTQQIVSFLRTTKIYCVKIKNNNVVVPTPSTKFRTNQSGLAAGSVGTYDLTATYSDLQRRSKELVSLPYMAALQIENKYTVRQRCQSFKKTKYSILFVEQQIYLLWLRLDKVQKKLFKYLCTTYVIVIILVLEVELLHFSSIPM